MTSRRVIIFGLAALALLAVPIQAVIDPSIENIACACIVLASSLVMLMYIGCTDALATQPLSTFALFGFCVTTQLGALLIQSVEWTSLRGSLFDGMYTFGTLAFYQSIAIIVHATFRFFSRPRSRSVHLVRGLLTWAGIYLTPSCNELWLIGFVGLASYVVYISEALLGSPLGKIGLAVNYLAWAPFLIPFYLLEVGNHYCNWRLNRSLLLGYAATLVGLGLALNTRGVMFFGVATVGLLYLLAGMRSDRPLSGRAFFRIGGLVAIVVVLATPTSNLITAMAIARGLGRAPVVTKVERTFQVWQRPELIAAYRVDQAAAQRRRAYDEHYIENPILARFVMTKFHDNSLHFAAGIRTDDANKRLRNVSVQLLWAILPQPILDMLGVDVNKDDFNFSMGDYLPYLSHGTPLGGHSVGSMLGHGLALFGPLFPFIFAALCLGFFAVMNLLTIQHPDGTATVSALGMLQIWSYFAYGISYGGLQEAFEFLIRNFEQGILIYALVFGAARLILRPRIQRSLVTGPPRLDSGSQV
jgi:hypothetical protein